MALDVRRLRVLREVARHGSFSAAAEALAFTQPAVSRQVATLEAEAGARLVERTARGVRLTPAGELVLEHADAILDRLAAAESQLAAFNGLRAGRLRLGSFGTASATLTPLAIAAFTTEHPGVELRLTESTSPRALQLLAAGELDVALASDAAGPLAAADVELEELMEEEMYLAMPRAHPLATAKQLQMSDLRDATWIEGPDPVGYTPLLTAARAAGFEPQIGFQAAQWLAKQGLVAAGVGVTLIPSLALATVREDIVLRSLGPDAPRRRIYAAVQATPHRAPGVEPMRAILRRVAREHTESCVALIT
jgi:DNA-binding transcriptional LysR family regulator